MKITMANVGKKPLKYPFSTLCSTKGFKDGNLRSNASNCVKEEMTATGAAQKNNSATLHNRNKMTRTEGQPLMHRYCRVPTFSCTMSRGSGAGRNAMLGADCIAWAFCRHSSGLSSSYVVVFLVDILSHGVVSNVCRAIERPAVLVNTTYPVNSEKASVPVLPWRVSKCCRNSNSMATNSAAIPTLSVTGVVVPVPLTLPPLLPPPSSSCCLASLCSMSYTFSFNLFTCLTE